MNIMPLPVAASSHGLTAALARSATPTSKSCKARKLEFQDPAAMLFGRTEQMTVPSFPRRRQNTGLCDNLSCRGGERPHLSNTPSRRITDERDTGFHWTLQRGGWGRTPVGNPSLGACVPSRLLRQRLSRHPLSARDFGCPLRGKRPAQSEHFR